jgi:hypothetical protein
MTLFFPFVVIVLCFLTAMQCLHRLSGSLYLVEVRFQRRTQRLTDALLRTAQWNRIARIWPMRNMSNH